MNEHAARRIVRSRSAARAAARMGDALGRLGRPRRDACAAASRPCGRFAGARLQRAGSFVHDRRRRARCSTPRSRRSARRSSSSAGRWAARSRSQWALAHPQRIARLVLVATTPRFVAGDGWEHCDVGADAATLRRRARSRVEARRCCASSRCRCAAASTGMRRSPRCAASSSRAASRRGERSRRRSPRCRRRIFAPTVPRIAHRALVVAGERDTLAPAAAGEWLAATMPNGRLRVDRRRRACAVPLAPRCLRSRARAISSMTADLPREPDAAAIDPRAVRRQFARAAATYDAAAVLQREVGARMMERLDVVRLAPMAILDAGCGTGEALPELAARYPQSRRVALDIALPMLAAARERTGASRSLLDKLLSPLGGRAPARPRWSAAISPRFRSRRPRSVSYGAISRCNGSPSCRAPSPRSTACSKSAGSSRSRRSAPIR